MDFLLVVGPFTEIKTGYWGFETKKSVISYVCYWHWLFLAGRLDQNLQLEMAFARY